MLRKRNPTCDRTHAKKDQKAIRKALIRPGVSIVSPLRYPGAKRRLAAYIREVLRLNELHPKLFVEPFAGGASVALQLAQNEVVDKIALGEKDELVASFWKVVFGPTRRLIELIKWIEDVEISLENWDMFRNNNFRSHSDRALACIFLNRTSFSGILAPTAGPIGGRAQESPYKIDCRFTRATLTKRIRQAAALKNRVAFVHHGDWQETIEKAEKLGYSPGEVFYYLDPPFYSMGPRLYKQYFDETDHITLHGALMKLQHPWLLSYDPAKPILDLYSHNGRGPKRIDLLYSASTSQELCKAQELVVTNLSRLPKETRMWRSSTEWRTPARATAAK